MTDAFSAGTINFTGEIVAPNPWARISEIATKVGVAPIKPGHPPTVEAIGADGLKYDIWEVLSATLDKIEQAVR